MAAYEVLSANEAIRNLIREGKSRQIRNVITTSQGDGMQTMEMDLARLIAAGLIDFDTAAEISAYPKEIMTHANTLRAQNAASATIASGQAGQSGAGVVVR